MVAIASLPAAVYFGTSTAFYAWLNAADPERWPAAKAAMWSGGSIVLCILAVALFGYAAVSLVKDVNRRYRIKTDSNGDAI